MNYKRNLKRELSKMDIPNRRRALCKVYVGKEEMATVSKSSRRRVVLIPMVAVILCLSIVGVVAVAVPSIIKYLNARALADNNGRLDTVPEGYVGIYTAADLDGVRSNPDTNYILMNDITFADEDYLTGGICEGGWIPIGSESDTDIQRYSGIFNGNGYVIRNLKINCSNDVKRSYFGLFGDTSGYFINLGIEGYELNLSFEQHDPLSGNRAWHYTEAYLCVGSVAATATFVGGCYLDGGSINVSLAACEFYGEENISQKNLCVGGICGIANYVDSCTVIADISVGGENSFNVYAGLCAGQSSSCLTSYTVGNIYINGSDYESVSTDKIAVMGIEVTIPVIIDEDAMNKLLQEIDGYYGEGSFDSTKLKSVFVRLELSENTESNVIQYEPYLEANRLFGYSVSESDSPVLYVLDSECREEEVKEINKILKEVFGDSIYEFFEENNIKCGRLYCYSFDSESDINSEALVGFDFENIWAELDGRVIPRIFCD